MIEVHVQAGLLDAGQVHGAIEAGLSGKLIGVSAFGDGRPVIVYLDDSATQADIDALKQYETTGEMPAPAPGQPTLPLKDKTEALPKRTAGMFPPTMKG